MIEYNNIILINNNINSINLFIFIILTLLAAITIDILFGELPTKIHPVVIIGSITNFSKNIFIKIKNKTSGLLVVLTVNIIILIILYIIYQLISVNIILLFIIYSILLSSTFSINMLLKTASDVEKTLNKSIDEARELVSYLVSRNTDELTESFIVSATIESLTENITDSYVAPVFYYFILALILLKYQTNNILFYLLLIPMFYRITNTLDAMLGYKTDELKNIGYVPAKLDDILNYIPARIAGLFNVISAYILKFNGKNALNIMLRDARNCPSPNSGYTMASTAGALNIQLIKKGIYVLGDDIKDIDVNDISKAIKLSKVTMILFTLTIILLFTITYMVI
ncbi:MAG: cobalamin biosynthesis protein [Methanobrevibacter thaueri]|nr:cobalamin biosynthesis protein [Methanobrevibacter thaueri]